MIKTLALALCATLMAGSALAGDHRPRDYSYERGDPRAPGGWERGSGYEYGNPRDGDYASGDRYEHRAEYDSRYDSRDRYDDRAYGYGDRYSTGVRYDGGGYEYARRSEGYSLQTYGDAAQHYGYPRGCGCVGLAGGGGAVSLPGSFFYDNGGVGPIPDGGYSGGGGGYVYGGAGAGAYSSASASAYASSRASVRIGGGYKGGGGGKGCCHGGKGK